MNNCPEISTLISFAPNPDAEENAEIAAHVFDCPDCQKNLEIIHETMLADKWSNPRPKGKPEGDVVADGNPVVENHGDDQDSCAAYIFEATKDMRDRFGKMTIPAGGRYLKDPRTEEVELLTPESERRFKANGNSWYLWFDPLSVDPATGRKEVEKVGAAKKHADKFMDELDLNMAGLKGKFLPDCNLSFFYKYCPVMSSFGDVLRKPNSFVQSDDDALWYKALQDGKVVPQEYEVYKNEWKRVEAANRFAVWEVGRSGAKFRVFAAFVTVIKRRTDATGKKCALESCRGGSDVADVVRKYSDEWNQRHPDPGVCCCCYTFASENGWDENCQSSASVDTITVFSQPDSNIPIGWSVRAPHLQGKRMIFQTLITSLYPVSFVSQLALIKGMLERTKLVEPFFSATSVSKETGIPECRVMEAFERLRRDKKQYWCAGRNANGENDGTIYWEKVRQEGVDKGKPFVVWHGKWYRVTMQLVIALLSAVGATSMTLCNGIGEEYAKLGGATSSFPKEWVGVVLKSVWRAFCNGWVKTFLLTFVIWLFVEVVRSNLRRRIYD